MGPDELVELELHSPPITILGILDEKHHEKGEDGCPGINNELPGIRILKVFARQRPECYHDDRASKGQWRAHEERCSMCNFPKEFVHRLWLIFKKVPNNIVGDDGP